MSVATSASSVSRRVSPARWKEWWPFFLLAALFALGYRELFGFTPISPVNESSGNIVEGQIFIPNQKSVGLVFGLSAFFLLSRAGRFRESMGGEPAIGLSAFLFAVGLATGTWSHYTGELAISIVSLSLTLLATAALLGGVPAFRLMLLPALMMLLAVPIPGVLLNSLIYPLQLSTAVTTGQLLTLVGIEPLVSGDTIYAGTNAFHVIEGCSGLRAMETMLMTAVVYQALVPHSSLYSWILVVAAPAIGFFVNQLRVLMIILNPNTSAAEDHSTQGIIMIVFGTLALIGLGMLLARILPKSQRVSEIPEVTKTASISWPWRRVGLVVGVLVVSIAMTLGGRWEVERPEHISPILLPAQFDGWVAEPTPIDEDFYGSTHHTQLISRMYRRGKDEISVFLATDARKHPLLSGISQKNESLGQSWQTIWQRPLTIDGLPGVRATTSIQQRLSQFAYVVSWHQGVDTYTKEALRNALALDRSPWQRPYDATAVRISTPLPALGIENEAKARRRIAPFIEQVVATFSAPSTSTSLEISSLATPSAESGSELAP